jgi:TetR/AcrR family transcriptional regulator, transcriptional repressor for nem operon
MARPRGFDDDEVGAGLLDAFWLHGYARTSVPHLTNATGLLPGSLYGAFGSKEAMFRVAVARYVDEIRRAVTSGHRGLAGIAHVLGTVVRLTAKDPARRGCLILNAIPESQRLSAATRSALQDGLDEMRRLLRARLREAGEDAERDLDARDLDRLEALCFAAAVATRVLGRAGQPRRLLQSIADGATAAVRRALEPEASRRGGRSR